MKEKLKILHLEDSPQDAEIVEEMLTLGKINVDISLVNNKNDFIKNLESRRFDLVLSDYNLPEWDGLKALLETRTRNEEIPFIYVSGTIGEERAVQCLQLGAMDYVIKGRMDRLVPAVKRALRLVEEIKERKKAERELKKIQLAVENTGEAIFMTDVDAKFLYINPAFTEIYGWKSEEVIGIATPNILKSDVHPVDFYSSLWNQIKLNKPFQAEMVNKTKTGKFIEIKNMISPVLDETNNCIGYVSIQNDISIKKEQERAIEKAKNEAEEMNRLKSCFLANISHEMRTPLISIIGFSEILYEELEVPEQKESAKTILEGGLRLQNTITEILALQDLEKSKIEIVNRRFNLIELLKTLPAVYHQHAEKKHLSIQTSFSEEEIWINSDAELLKKIIGHVLDNGIKFTKKGGVTIETNVILENEVAYASINIMDTGIGISSDQLQLIFTPFRQASEGLSRSHEGMGLGLSISKQFIDLLHGKIQITSEIGKGTNVNIMLPALPREKEILKEINLRKSTSVDVAFEMKSTKPKLLLVEDNAGNRMLFKKYLEKEFIVDEAVDGISAIASVQNLQYDLILMDINLGPGLDGVETFHRIRQLPSYKNIPVVAVTAFAMVSDKKKFLDEGFTAYMKKPLDRKELVALIKQLLEQEH